MNKKWLATLVFAVAMLSLLPTFAPDKALAAEKFSFKASSLGGDAVWTTCPDGPSVGDTCTDTFVFAAEQVTREGKTKSASEGLFLDQFSYTVDGDGNFVFLGSRFGFDENAEFSMSKPTNKLQSASASADVPVIECDEDFLCEDGGSVVHVEVDWIGEGSISKNKSHFHSISDGVKFHFSGKGSFRTASATGEVDGDDTGSILFADLFKVKEASMTICHDC